MAVSIRRPFVRRIPWLWAAITLLAVAAVGTWGLVSQPAPYRWLGPALTALALGAVVWIALRGPSYLDGTVLVQRGPLRTHRSDLARATRVRLRPNMGGSAQLVVADETGASAFASLLTLDRYVTVAQPPELLDAIGDALVTARDSSAAAIRKVLAMQADHLRAGGSPGDSPLRPLTSTALLRSAEAAGLVALLGNLD